MHKWGLVPSANCRCGAKEQTADHMILASYPLYHPPNGKLGLAELDEDTVWTGLKQQHSASDDILGPNEEEDQNKTYKDLMHNIDHS